MTEDPLTIEDYLGSRRAQRLIVAQVTAIADLLAKTPEAEDDMTDCDIDCVIHEPLVSVPLFDFLIETNRLPEFSDGKRIIYQLVSNKLAVDIMPSLCHDNAAGSFTNDLLRWSESGGVLDCLENGLGGGTTLPSSREWLASIGCAGGGKVYRFAQIVAAAARALELSASAAMATAGSENFFKAHHERGGLR